MRQAIEFLVRVALVAFIWLVWWWALDAPLSDAMNLSIIVGGVLLAFPLVWLGRKILDKQLSGGIRHGNCARREQRSPAGG
jgi:hypothetical protein